MKFFWPDIDDINDAHKACHRGAGMAFFVALATAIVAWLQTTGKINLFPGIGAAAFLDAGLFLLIGIGLLFHSRLAALAGLLLFAAERVYMFTTMKSAGTSQIFTAILFGLAFVAGVRGAFAWHEFRKLGQEVEVAQPEEVSPVKKWARRILLVLILLGLGGAAYYFLFVKNKPAINSSSITDSIETNLAKIQNSIPGRSKELESQQSSNPSSGSITPEAQDTPAGGSRTFHLKNGETVRGRVVLDDIVYYNLETSSGQQKTVIKEDIVSEE